MYILYIFLTYQNFIKGCFSNNYLKKIILSLQQREVSGWHERVTPAGVTVGGTRVRLARVTQH